MDAANWTDGVKTAGTIARTVKKNVQLEENDPLAIELGNQILRKLGANPFFISFALPHRIYPPRFNRYADGGTYGAHIDSALLQVPGINLTVRADMSVTLFLSEPDEYEGGELEVETGNGLQSAKLPAGDMVLYLSGSLHRVTPVTKGARVASFFWVQSVVRDESQRAILFDLDRSIQELTPKVSADNPALLRLTGLYHNLLRGWANN
jgi:PKHD-type hydroxylase